MLKRLTLISIFTAGLFIGSCVEEPTIAPVKIPFSMVRFGNMVSNVGNVDVLVDGNVMASNLAQNTFTDFVQLTSGKRNFVLRNTATGETMFEKSVDATSYDEISFYFAGYYSSSIDTSTMGLLSRIEGATYNFEGPDADSAQVYFLHGSADTPTDSTRGLDIYAKFMRDDTEVDSLLTPNAYDEFGAESENIFMRFGDVNGATLPANQYTFHFDLVDLDGDETDSVMASIDFDVAAGTRTYIYISGPSSGLMVEAESIMPLPVQEK